TGTGVPEDGLRGLAIELGGAGLGAFFDAYVDGTGEMPLGPLLATHGVTLGLRPAQGPKDRGGKPGNGEPPGASPGMALGGELRLQHVFAGGAAEAAGLASGDTLVALDGVRASADRLEAIARDGRPGDRVAVHAFRRDELFDTTLVLAAPPSDTAWLV